MRAWLADPQRYKPGALMPRVLLSPADLDAVVVYLGSLK
jgi:cytochrome c oxidase subunit 2